MPKIVSEKSKFSQILAKTKLNFYNPGDIVEACILLAGKNKIWVDIDRIGVGVIYGRELSADTPKLKPGDKILASVIAPEDDDGNMVLSLKRADRERFWKELEVKHKNNETLPVKIIDANKGGLMVEASGVSGFLPVSQLSYQHYPKVEDGDRRKILEKLKRMLGQTLTVKILTFEKSRNNLIFSEKAAGDKIKEEAVAGLKVGDKIKGIVSGVIDFGIFIRFNNIEGLVHISEVSWDRVKNLKEMFKAGDEIEAEIISILGSKVSLSIKRLLPDKWVDAADKYKVKQIVEAEATRIVPFGVFVKIDEVLDGLLHISDSESKSGEELEKEFEIGKKYSFQISNIDKDGHKIALKKVKDSK